MLAGAASISSSTRNAGDSLLPLKIVGVVRRVRTCRARTRLDPPVGDPMDIGLLEYELHSDLLQSG